MEKETTNKKAILERNEMIFPKKKFNRDFIGYSKGLRIRIAQFIAQEADFIIENSSTYREALENEGILFSQSNEFSDIKKAIRETIIEISLDGKTR